MRRALLISAAATLALSAAGQTFHIESGNVEYAFPASTACEMNFGAGSTLTIAGRTFELNDATEIWVDDDEVEENVVSISYAGGSASVAIAGNLASYIDATVSGAHVTLTQSAEVGETTCGEITYRLSGESGEGSLSMTGSYKATVELLGLNLTNPTGAVLDIQNGKRIAMSVKSGTTNTLTSGSESTEKGCVVCKGHLELKGKGELNVYSQKGHGIYAKEYVEMKNCTINILSAEKDGVNCTQYFLMESGALTISGTGDDGIQVDYKDSADREAEDTGSATIAGGSVNITVTAAAAKGIKTEGPITVSGGEAEIAVLGDGIWDSAKSKTKASACLGSDENVIIEAGELRLTASGAGGKGISCDGTLTVNGGDLDIRTSGGVLAYVNGSLNTNYTGNTDNLASDLKSSAKGIKADSDVAINGGRIAVVTSGNGAEGIESKATLTINDGEITVVSTDDAINSSSHMYIKGGTVTVMASGNDGLDSNGNMYIEGGYIMAFGSGGMECGIDANEEGGYSVVFTGGTLLAVGGRNSVPSSKSGSTQPYVSGSGSVTASSAITLTDASGNELAAFTVPENYTASGSASGPGGRPGGMGSGGAILITCPGIASGSSYTLKNGNATSTVTATLTGSSGGWGPGGWH